jgi:diguanylate cyclase (GGDEF)-like protein
MDRRLRHGRGLAFAMLAAALVVCAPFVGWWPVGVLVVTAGTWQVVERRVESLRKPEWLVAGGWLMTVVSITVGVMLTGGANSPAKSWLLIPVIALPSRFTNRGMAAGVAISLVALGIATIGADPADVYHHPELFVFPAALIGAALALSMALRTAEIQHRSEAVIDQLTGMLNRKALESRTAELEQQSRIGGQPVGLIACDIDHFKQVNDTHGHSMGDAVLKNVAYRIRKELRAYDLSYRIGGEEFVVLLPGAALPTTRDLAERLRTAVGAESTESVSVTMSFGVAASGSEGLDFKLLFNNADEALYRAKAGGRDRVCSADDPAFAVLA